MDGRSRDGQRQQDRLWDGPKEPAKDRTGGGMLIGIGFVVLVLALIWVAEACLR